MSDIRALLDGLVVVQSGLAITSPIVVGIKHAYKFQPDRSTALETPCWMNSWDLNRIDRKLVGGVLQYSFTIHTQLFVKDADLDRAADIATAFFAEYARALNNNITLGATVNTSDLRGGAPTLALLEWMGGPYPGLNLLLDVQTTEGVSFK